METNRQSTWRVAGFRLELYETGRRRTDGRAVVGYRFFDRNTLVFSGEDYYPTPTINPVGPEAQLDLLDFLALSPAESGADLFDQYTPKQYRWAMSKRADALRDIVFAR